MPTNSKGKTKSVNKSKSSSKNPQEDVSKAAPKRGERFLTKVKFFYLQCRVAIRSYVSRRPHRSFKLTRRRDYQRDLALPGYIAFTHEVNSTLWLHRKTFGWLMLIYVVLYGLLVGLGSQETYNSLVDGVDSASQDLASGGMSSIGQAVVVFVSVASNGLNDSITDAERIMAGILVVMMWLTVVWLLRNLLAGHKVKLRDALYSSGAPIFATIIMVMIMAVQLIPILLVSIAYAAASQAGMLDGGVEAMMFWLGAGLLGVLSIFWITGTLFGMVIVTLPGMYPMRALSMAGDMVTGRRVRILLRWSWMVLMVALTWVIVLLPLILLESWLSTVWTFIATVPIIPTVALALVSGSIIWAASYIYLVYRRVIDNEVVTQ